MHNFLFKFNVKYTHAWHLPHIFCIFTQWPFFLLVFKVTREGERAQRAIEPVSPTKRMEFFRLRQSQTFACVYIYKIKMFYFLSFFKASHFFLLLISISLLHLYHPLFLAVKQLLFFLLLSFRKGKRKCALSDVSKTRKYYVFFFALWEM